MYFERGCMKKKPQITVVSAATILSIKYISDIFPWGVGGVLNSQGAFVEESAMEYPERFGGAYEYSTAETEKIDKTIIFMGPLKTHWGHFLIDFCTRLWFLCESQTEYDIAYCGFQHKEKELPKEYVEFFSLMDITKERLHDIRRPTAVEKVIIPEQSFVPGQYFYEEFLNIFNRVTQKVNKQKYQIYDKVYFTRTKLYNKREIGEELIEKIFSNNGFKVLSPEKLTVSEQIAYVSNCKVFASLEGTVAHNIIFAQKETKQIILTKHKYVNLRQQWLEKILNINATYISVVQPIFINFPPDNFDTTFWLRVNDKFKQFGRENAYTFPDDWKVMKTDFKNFWSYFFIV